jgi:hypothetical protein
MLQRPQTLLFLAAAILTIFATFAPLASYAPSYEGASQDIQDSNPRLVVGTSDMNFEANYVKKIHKSEKRFSKDMTKANEQMDEAMAENGISTVFTIGLVGTLLLAACILMLVFLYKSRKIQIRLGIALFLLTLAITAGIFIGSKIGIDLFAEFNFVPMRIADLEWNISYQYGFFLFPIIAVCLLVGVLMTRRDDNLVKSLDRLR